MNKTKVTTRKGSKTKSKKESPEVFVLPPNLLEKLGINLGNYGSSTESTASTQTTDININSSESQTYGTTLVHKKGFDSPTSVIQSSSEVRSSSIIETAELMRKSVFLSPTFISNNSSVIQGEIEIVGNVSSERTEFNAVNEDPSVHKDTEVCRDTQRERAPISNVEIISGNPKSSSTQANNQCDQIVNGNVKVHDLEMKTIVDDHADEAYSSDCSNSNTACSLKHGLSKSIENKINIISEEIIHPTQLYKLKNNGSPQENSFIHIPINATITSHKKLSARQHHDNNVDLSSCEIGNIVPAEMSVANDSNDQDVLKHNFVNVDDVSLEDIEMLQNINKIDLCAVLNVSESDFIMTTEDQLDSQQDHVALPISHEQEMSIETAIVVPCHIDFVVENNIMVKEREHLNAYTYSEHGYEVIKESSEVNTRFLGNNIINEDLSTKTSLNENETDMLVDKNTATSCIIETVKEIQTSSRDQCSLMKGCIQNENTHDNRDICQEALDSKTDASISQNNNAELLSTQQNAETDLLNADMDISRTDNQKVSIPKSTTENVLKSVDKCRQRSKSILKSSDESKDSSLTKISLKSKHKQSNNNAVQEISAGSPIVYFKHYKKQICEKTKAVENRTEEKVNMKISDGCKDNDYQQNNKLEIQLMNKTVTHEDKIREIAKYLSEFADLKKRNHFIETNKMVGTACNKKNVSNSKSSIQGVEKPGGSGKKKNTKNYPPNKTYERRGRQGWKNIPLFTFKESSTSTQSIDLVDNVTINVSNELEVCLCRDFGQLMSYDDVNSYEHIHFWNNARTDCTPDLIFSIYNEDAAPVTNYDDTRDYPIDDSDEISYKLCWNEIKPDNKKKTDNNVTPIHIDNVLRKNENEKQEAEKEHKVGNIMPTVNILPNCEGIPNDKHESSAETGQKRRRSKVVSDNGEPPAKSKKQGTPKRVSETKEIPTSTNSVKDNPVKNSPQQKYSSTPLRESATHSTDQNDAGPSIPVSDTAPTTATATEPHSEASASTNEVIIECQPTQPPTDNENTAIICGVCHQSVDGDWIEHISSKHDYLAWKLGEPSLDVHDEVAVREHLNVITKTGCGLTCGKCGLTRKYVKAYLSHVRRCSGLKADSSSEVRPSEEPVKSSDSIKQPPADEQEQPGLVICGVCQESMQDSEWNEHRASRHNYLAWKCGELPLDVTDEDAVKAYLYEITKASGGLTCAKCGLTRKYVKAYLSHIRSCNGLSESQNDSTYNVSSEIIPKVEPSPNTVTVTNENLADTNTGPIKCGVCEELVQTEDWNHHIGSRHDYLAWQYGKTPLDVNDEEVVRNHLYEITKACGGLTCSKCGLTRKYVKAYLSHIKSCDGLDESQNDSTCNVSCNEVTLAEKSSDTKIPTKTTTENNELVKCATCKETMLEKVWVIHIATQHDYLAWKVGDAALDIHDETVVKDHLYAIANTCGGLTCSKCGLTRKYVKSYLSHFKNCSGDDESQNTSACDTSTEKSVVDAVDVANSSTSNSNERESLVKCGVCSLEVQETEWNSHIGFLHNYLAWKFGEESLDLTDALKVRKHLVSIKNQIGGLTCAKCCKNIKTVKKYRGHIESCEGMSSSDLKESSLNLVVERQTESLATADSELVKCGVCGQYSAREDWTQHVDSHGYLAWREGDPPINTNDEDEVRLHLRSIINKIGTLICQKCKLACKSVKSYLRHVKICDRIKKEKNENNPAELETDKASTFKCGVCKEVVISVAWSKHLSEKHDYLAWKEGDAPLKVDDEEAVYQHLFNCTKEFGSLHCKYCGKSRKYAKSFMEHIQACKTGGTRERAPGQVVDFDDFDFASGGTCSVCEKEIEAGNWIHHTQKDHNYLAWRKGERPWNLDDFEDINQYLYVICKRMDGLTCNKCGLVRKYVKTFLTHIKNCDVVDSSVVDAIGPSSKEEHQCAMCKEVVKATEWKNHAVDKHYNVTWIVGETPIDIKNVYAVERFLKEYKQIKGSLKCNACGTTRASFAGFYAHIIICKKTEEEIEMYRSLCDICNNKYLCIYKNQHAMMHRVQVLTAEAKILPVEEEGENESPNLSGKRRAAVKARSVIENYSDSMSKHSLSCQSCGFSTDFKEELNNHKCEESNEKDFSGEEDSAAEIGSSEDESGDTDIDSNVSDELDDSLAEDDNESDGFPTKKKRYRDAPPVMSKVTRIPFKVDDVNSYIRDGDVDFCKTHLTDEVLFPQWQCQHEPIPESELTRYMPPLEHSCKFKTDSNWTTLNKFQALQEKSCTSIFVGASIVCITWVPPRLQDMTEGGCNFLAVACHNGPDCPRYHGGETPRHENLIQIWNFNKFQGFPELALGIAHDFGTVWSMDWCPSGARDVLTAENATSRLGLLAIACSSGSVYILAVPHPSTVVKNNQIVHKLKPVAELRMIMGSNRKSYQATSVSWSKQKQHNLVLVGYADGSTAYYDLHTDSPLLSAVENNVQVFHPYYDERPHNTCITGTDLYPVPGDAAAPGSGVWTAPTGAELAARAGTGAPGRARLATASLGAAFAPQSCSAVLAGDDAIMQASVSELVWVPPGRRLGGTRCAAGCARCGRVAASMPPSLRIMRLHPAYSDAKKQIIGMLEMTHLAKKRKKKVNDELSMTVEPLTYEDAVRKYGIAFTRIAKSDRSLQQQCSAQPKTHCPERFPLADVESMAFCPSRRFHEKLAIATHAGILFLIATN